jgi:hypothetical protein
MQTLKKRDIKGYKPKGNIKKVKDDLEDDLEETEIVDELVNGLGGSISGDEKNVNNSEIKTAPQNTTDQHADTAIQPNRPLYNVNSIGGRSMGSRIQASYKIAKDKAITLLEDLDSDFNDNSIIDTKELPDGVTRKMLDLVKSVELNGLSNDINKIEMILNFINSKLKPNA